MVSQAMTTEGVELRRGDGGNPEVFTLVAELTDFDGPGGSAAIIDVTHFQSLAKEKRAGLPDEGQFTFNANFVASDLQQQGMVSDRNNRTVRNWELHFTDTPKTVAEFAALVMEFHISSKPVTLTTLPSGPIVASSFASSIALKTPPSIGFCASSGFSLS